MSWLTMVEPLNNHPSFQEGPSNLEFLVDDLKIENFNLELQYSIPKLSKEEILDFLKKSQSIK